VKGLTCRNELLGVFDGISQSTRRRKIRYRSQRLEHGDADPIVEGVLLQISVAKHHERVQLCRTPGRLTGENVLAYFLRGMCSGILPVEVLHCFQRIQQIDLAVDWDLVLHPWLGIASFSM